MSKLTINVTGYGEYLYAYAYEKDSKEGKPIKVIYTRKDALEMAAKKNPPEDADYAEWKKYETEKILKEETYCFPSFLKLVSQVQAQFRNYYITYRYEMSHKQFALNISQNAIEFLKETNADEYEFISACLKKEKEKQMEERGRMSQLDAALYDYEANPTGFGHVENIAYLRKNLLNCPPEQLVDYIIDNIIEC